MLKRVFVFLLSFFFFIGGTLATAKAASVEAADGGISLTSYEPDDSDLNGSVLYNFFIVFYDSSGTVISASTSTDGSFTIPAGTYYFYFRFNYDEPLSFSGSYKYIISIKSIDPLQISSCRYVQFIEELDNGYYDIPVYDFTYITSSNSTEYNTLTMSSYDVYYNNINTVRMSFYLSSIPVESIIVESLILNIVPFDDLSLDETNSLISTSNSLLSNIISSISSAISAITALPAQIINLFIDAMKSLFIPSDDYFTTKFNELYVLFDDKLGFLMYPTEIFSSFVSALQTSSDGFVIDFPAFSMDVGGSSYQVWDDYTFNFDDIKNNFPEIFSAAEIIFTVILCGYSINLIITYYDVVVWGSSSTALVDQGGKNDY